MLKLIRLSIIIVSILAIVTMAPGAASAASTSKTLSTNYTLVNFGTEDAAVTVQYYKDNGTTWDADTANESFSIPANGGSVQIRQYFDQTMSAGSGSAVVSSSEPLGGVVQILARNQTPTSGAYSAFTTGSNEFYVPNVAHHGVTANGAANSQIVIQNIDTTSLDITVDLIPATGYTGSYQETISGLAEGVSYYYDLEGESNLPSPWFGSAVVTASGTGKITVVSNLFIGANALQTSNGFPAESLRTDWIAPYFSSRLSNGQSSVITVQNLSGGSFSSGSVSLDCVKDANSSGPTNPHITNDAVINNNASYSFNALADSRFPTNWYGSCKVTAPGNTVAYVQLRYAPGSATIDFMGAYEAVPPSSTDTTLYVPLIGKRLGNGFATVVTIQNMNPSVAANVTLNYIPSSTECPVSVCDTNGDQVVDANDTVTVSGVSIPEGGSIVRNHRLVSGANSETALPSLWVGSLQVTSDQPITGFVQITNLLSAAGDTFMAYDALTQP